MHPTPASARPESGSPPVDPRRRQPRTGRHRLTGLLLVLLIAAATLVVPLPPGATPVAGAQTLPEEASPSTFFVDAAAGNDGRDGQTLATAWATLDRAARAVRPGDTVYVRNGTYRNMLYIDADGRSDAWITFAAYPGHRPRVEVGSGDAVLLLDASYVEIRGFDIAGVGYTATNDYGYGFDIGRSHHITIRDNRIHGFGTGGLGSMSASHLRIEGNTVFDNAFWSGYQGSGISLFRPANLGFPDDANGYSNYIVDNTVYANENKVNGYMIGSPDAPTDGNGIIVDQADVSGYGGRTLVANNRIFDNGGKAVNAYYSSRIDIVHNTTYRNSRTPNVAGGPAEISVYAGRDVRVANNIVWSRPGSPAVRPAGGAVVAQTTNVLVDDGSTTRGSTDLVTDRNPGLRTPSTDPATADFSLVAGGLAVDRGTTAFLRAVPVDADGMPRPAGAAPDPGADEYEGGGATEVTTTTTAPTTTSTTTTRPPTTTAPTTTSTTRPPTATPRITVVGTARSTSWAGDAVSWPAGIRSGDVAIAVLADSAQATAARAEGWTPITQAVNGQGWAAHLWVGYRVLNGAERGDIGAWTVVGGRVNHATLVILRGVDPTRPVDAVGPSVYAAEPWFTPENPGVTTRTPGAVALTAMSSGPAARQSLDNPGWTEVASRDGVYSGEHVHLRTIATPGATGRLTWTSPDATASWGWYSSVSLALRPRAS